MPDRFWKDPDATLNYKFDFAAATNGTGDTDWLASGETISSINSITADTGITADAGTITDSNTSVTVQVSGGTAGQSYKIACKITTSSGQIVEKTITITVQEQ